ncbi:predicted protein [Chaetomium globosum CBS 148.51]|uniref:Aminoglycoside phosphotransferase domain-containing protein n=1 Tax=Chaetomium globosum (strain ATCC 6205 / CBS 148.51 / DSM 1962 / NBRC 6347 / NRRL 1970) TaxID=306901 RepID=Q2GM74_CHAGB|nr:uncharacterized protein CHGG_10930 [Chaetomium globosum CBS 148.51]EAQ83112.1 predicted protein [Chaetomium globosum CBS 148.51]
MPETPRKSLDESREDDDSPTNPASSLTTLLHTTSTLLSCMRHPTPPPAANSTTSSAGVSRFVTGRVLEHTTADGAILAIKVNTVTDRSEPAMMHYAATHGVRTPRVRGVYDVVAHTRRLARAMVSERVPGVPLAEVWLGMGEVEREVVKEQLRGQLVAMRACREGFIGGVGGEKVRNVYDRMRDLYCGPFEGEEAFDEWCLGRILGGPLVRAKWRLLLRNERRERRGAGVGGNVVTGIVDWERSGFFPEYAEYAFAMVLCHAHEEWWIPVLKELLPPCSKRRLEFTALVEEGVVNS